MPAKRWRCDKCCIIVDGGRRGLDEHKNEYHSYGYFRRSNIKRGYIDKSALEQKLCLAIFVR